MITYQRNSQNHFTSEKIILPIGSGKADHSILRKYYPGKHLKFKPVLLMFLLLTGMNFSYAQGPLNLAVDPVCSTNCCSGSQPCNCSAGIVITGGFPPYTITVTNGSSVVGTTACVTGLCPGTYYFEVRDAALQQAILPVTVGGNCCHLVCSDTTICFDVLDSLFHPAKPNYSGGGAGGSTGGGPCAYDSIWNNAPLVFPVGTTVITWYILTPGGQIDSCTQNVIRKPPSVYTLCFTTTPPVVGGVINICNGQSITFDASCSTGISGLLWNFGNGYYSSNAIHTEPASHYPPGTYYDTLTVFDDCGNPHDTAFTVHVDSASGPDIYCISVVCPGDTVTYHTHANCTTYNWGVTGGVFSPVPPATSDSATVIWGPGPHGTISLNVSGCTPPSTCNISTIKNVDIVPATLPVKGDTIVCAGATITYCIECIPGNSHNWEMIPATAGTITGQGTCCLTITLNPSFFGIITLTVNYQNVLTGSGCNLPVGCSNDHGCGGTGTINITVRPIFGISGPAKVCPNAVGAPFNGMNLTNATIEALTSWKIIKPDNTSQSFANTGLFNSYSWNTMVGVYKIIAYAPLNTYCNDSAVTTVEVVDMKTPNIITGPDTVCAGTPAYYSVVPNMSGVTYTWTVTGGTLIPPLNNSTIGVSWFSGGGTLTVVQSLSASPFCVSNPSPVKIVTTWPNFSLPVITPSGPLACLKGSITYSIPPALINNGTYIWSVVPPTAGNIISANGTDSITIQWIDNSITPIYVKLKITRCYSDSVMLPVTLFSLPLVPSINYTPLNPCIFNTVSFTTSSPGPVYNWDFGDLTSPAVIQNPFHPYNVSGDFIIRLYVTNAQGCSDTAFSSIHVDSIPVIPTISGPTSICLNNIVSYSFPEPLFNGANYTWSLSSPALGNILSSSPNYLSVNWNSPGVDTVKLHVQSTCLDTVLKYVITVHALPIAGITVPSPACQGAALTFNGTGGVSYSWSFAGGSPSTSSLQSPVVSYGAPGTFGVILFITDAFGCTDTKNTTIVVNPLPLAIITGPAGVCTFPTTVTLSAVNAGGYSFSWTPGGSSLPSLTTVVTAPTTYSVVVTNSFGCTQTSNSITINSGLCPVVVGPCPVTGNINFTNTPPVCLSETYSKTGSATLAGWNFGDGGSAGAVSPVSHSYAFPGVYMVTVSGTLSGIDGTGQPCTSPIDTARIITVPFDAHFDFNYQCNGVGVMQTNLINTSLYLNSASLYSWTWKDVTYATTLSSLAFPGAITIAPAGPHVISLTIIDPVTHDTCTVTNTINVPVPITASFTVSTPVCQNSAAVFTDNSSPILNESSRLFDATGSGPTSILSPCSLIYVSTGSFTAKLNVTDIYGCNSLATQPVTVLSAGTGSITVTNNCDSVELLASPSGPYVWQIISPPPSPPNPAYVKTSGYYSVTGVSGNGCPYTAGPVLVTVKHSPVATITGKTTYCQGEKLDLKTSSAGVSFVWQQISPPGGIVGSTPNLNIVPGVTGTIMYQVTITGANGCTASATYTVVVDPVPPAASIIASGPLTFCQDDSVILTVNPPGATYLWSKSPTPPLSSPTNTYPALTVKESGTYSVIVQTVNGCPFPAITPVQVTVNPKPTVKISGDTVLCEGETLTLTTTDGPLYSWTGPAATGNTNPFIKANMLLTDAGVYTVVVTNANGCTQSASVNVIVNPAPVTPVITSSPGGVLCEGQLVVFTASPPPVIPVVYTWSTGQNGVSISAALAGDYYVVATNQFGCSSTSNILTIHPLPDLSCVPSGCYDFCNECSFVVIPGPAGFASYTWEKLTGNIFSFYSATQNLTVFPPGGMYRLIAYNAWGCSDSTDTLKINFHDCCNDSVPIACVDTSCHDFSDNLLHNFIPYSLAPNVNISLNNTGGQYVGDVYVKVVDLPGLSAVKADTTYNGKWCCGNFTYDFKIFDDGIVGSANVQPKFMIYNSVINKGFVYTSGLNITENSSWATINACAGVDSMPVASANGFWAPLAPAVAGDWPTVAGNVTDVVFNTEVTGNNNEVVGIDNVCFTPKHFSISCSQQSVCGGANLSVVVTDTGGCSSFKYHWSNGATTADIDLVPPGTYCVTVSNCCGCVDSCCMIVYADTTYLHVTDTIHQIDCDSIYGSIILNPYGGLPPYQFYWSNGDTTKNVYGLSPGPYSVTIVDQEGCVIIIHDTIIVKNNCNCNSVPPPPGPTITIINVVPDSCNESGCIQATFTGCCLKFSYTYYDLCNPAVYFIVPPTNDSSIFCHLRAGYYILTITDGCGNSVSQGVLVPLSGPPLTVTISYSNCGDSICANAEGGCPPYIFSWSNNSTKQCISGFTPCVDLYLTVTDSRGCSFTKVVSAPGLSASIIQPSCCGLNGSICLSNCSSTGGTAGYSYLWSNGETTQCIYGLAAGTYCVTVTTPYGDQFTCCYQLTNTPVTPPSVNFIYSNCGSSVIAVINGVNCANYSYHWENGSTIPERGNLEGCDTITFTIVLCDGSVYNYGFRVPHVTFTYTPVNCVTGLGTICVSVSCFRCEPYTYSWTPSPVGTINDSACFQCPPGTYTVCITNACGDVVCCTFTLPPPTVIVVTDTVYHINCDSLYGTILTHETGGVGHYHFEWSNGETTQDIYNLSAGVYSLTVTDSVGCNTTITDTVKIEQTCNCNSIPPPPLPTITVNSIVADSCNQSGCIHMSFTGCCLRFSYSYYNPCNPGLSYSVAQTRDSTIFCHLRAGTYTIFAEDGCGHFATQSVTVPLSNGPLTATVNVTGCASSMCVTASGGCPPYTYLWSGGITTQCISSFEPCVSMIVTVTDSRGCTFSTVVTTPQVTFTNIVQPHCCLANGSICAQVCFGSGPYTYLWNTNPPRTTSCISGLTAGIYCVTVTNASGGQIQCCYNLTDTVIPPPVSFIFNNCGGSVFAEIGETNCSNYSYYWENGSTSLERNNILTCDSLVFTIVACNGNVYHHGFRVPHLYPAISPVNCFTGVGTICVPVECFRCEPYTYTFSPMLPGCSVSGNCLTCPPGSYTVCITNSCGDVICCQVYLPPPLPTQCHVIIHIKMFIEGYYSGGGLMDNGGSGGCLYVNGFSSDTGDADTVFVSAMESVAPYTEVDQQAGILHTDGTVDVSFGNIVSPGGFYYLKIKHRNAVETWSAAPVMMAPVTTYDFTTGQSQAYGNNQSETFDQQGWAFYSGDISDASLGVGHQDGVIESQDYSDMENAVYFTLLGYNIEDITGDGIVESADYSLMENNIYYTIISMRP